MRGSPGILLPSALQLTKLIAEDVLLKSSAVDQAVTGNVNVTNILAVGASISATNINLLINKVSSGIGGTGIGSIYNVPVCGQSITSFYDLYTRLTVNDTFTVGTHYGLYVANAVIVGTGAVTSQYGIYINDQTRGGTEDYGIAIEGADTCVLWLSSAADNTDAANGIMFGSSKDTNLYRSAANMLKTDDSLTIAGDSSVFGSFTITDAKNIALATTTGTQIGTGATQKLAFYGATPIVRPSAYTQTYSTASKTNPNATAATLTDNSGGAADTTLAAVEATYTQATIRNNFADLAAMVNKLTADHLATKKLLNSIIDDLQALGLTS